MAREIESREALGGSLTHGGSVNGQRRSRLGGMAGIIGGIIIMCSGLSRAEGGFIATMVKGELLPCIVSRISACGLAATWKNTRAQWGVFVNRDREIIAEQGT